MRKSAHNIYTVLAANVGEAVSAADCVAASGVDARFLGRDLWILKSPDRCGLDIKINKDGKSIESVVLMSIPDPLPALIANHGKRKSPVRASKASPVVAPKTAAEIADELINGAVKGKDGKWRRKGKFLPKSEVEAIEAAEAAAIAAEEAGESDIIVTVDENPSEIDIVTVDTGADETDSETEGEELPTFLVE